MGTPFIPELGELLRQVEVKFGHRLSTTTDYELLSFVIEREASALISASTIKRLWGYVSYSSTPRIATMDALSRYIGYRDFKAFREALKASGAVVSSFFTSKTVEAASLKGGAELLLGWAPNRLVKIKFLGGTSFEVESAENTKLRPGDRFEASEFILGAPLFIASIRRSDGTVTPPYVAGKVEGLNVLEVIPAE